MGNLFALLTLLLGPLVSFGQTAPNGQLSPGFSACEEPIRLSAFFNISPQWKISSLNMAGNYLAIVGKYIGPKTNPEDQDFFPLWVQDLGPDGILTESDFQIGVSTHYIATFAFEPVVKMSKTGWIALTIKDETTLGRTFDDPNWVYSPQQPKPTQIQVPADEVTFTCYYAVCVPTLQEVRRFMPIFNLTYTSPPYTNMQLDGMITGMHWETAPGGGFGSENLVYSWSQYFNGLVQAPPWMPIPPSPMPPVRLPHTGIEKFEPFSGGRIPVAYQATNGGQDASSFLLTDSAQTEQVSGIWPSYFGFFYHGTLALTGGIQLGDAFVLSQDPGFGSSSSYWGAMNTILDWEDGPSSYLWVRPWKSGPRQSSVGIAHSLVNGHETIALRTVLESTSTISIQKRDLVFRSSLNGYAGPDIPITPTEDWRDISAAFVMDHPVLPPTAGLGTMTVALDTWPFAAYSQKRTQIYQYHPSPIAGQIGSFVPYKEVLVTAPNQVFALYGATSTHVWGIHDDYSLPGPKVRDWVIVRCP